MGKKLILLLGIIVALGLGVAFWLYKPDAPEPERVVAAPPPPSPVAAMPPPIPVEHHPIAAVDASAAQEPLPDIEQSDTLYGQALAKLFGQKSLKSIFHSDRMIRRFVATIDNLPRHEAPVKMMPVKPVGGSFLVDRHETELSIAPANAQRYVTYLQVMAAADPRRLVDMYVSFYPLFQKAYRELGYPDGFFNDRLIEAIDNLLATPEPSPPIALEQPKVLYTYADKSVEARSAGQRIMLRMGAENRVKASKVLTAIRKELLSRSPVKD
jgi:hypothetical protein